MNDSQSYQSLHERVTHVLGIAAIPAVSVMVFTRSRLGYRQITLFRQIVATLFLLTFSTYSHFAVTLPWIPNYQGSVSLVFIFVVAMLAAGWWQKRSFKKELVQGGLWHSYSMGISQINRLYFFPYRVAEQYIEPIFIMLLGLFLSQISGLLGFWLFISGISISIWESWITEQMFYSTLNRVDHICEGEISAAEDKSLKEARDDYDKRSSQSLMDTAGIPTGIAPDIELQIQKRRNRQPLSGEAV
jgi:hypothetical protein